MGHHPATALSDVKGPVHDMSEQFNSQSWLLTCRFLRNSSGQNKNVVSSRPKIFMQTHKHKNGTKQCLRLALAQRYALFALLSSVSTTHQTPGPKLKKLLQFQKFSWFPVHWCLPLPPIGVQAMVKHCISNHEMKCVQKHAGAGRSSGSKG